MPIDLTPISTQSLYCTTRIEAIRRDGRTSVGTAFFINFKVDETHTLPVLVTNKHVIEETTIGRFLLHTSTTQPDGQVVPSTSVGFGQDGFEGIWVTHPEGVDLCGMPAQPLHEAVAARGQRLFVKNYDENMIPSAETLETLQALEDVVMVGYPIGVWDEANNLPLLRRGTTASHPAFDFNNQQIGLVDVAAFPGSSGSPVMVLNEGSYRGSQGLVIGSRMLLLGVLSRYYYLDNRGSPATSEIPTTEVAIAGPRSAVHLGVYIKARELLVLKRVMLERIRETTPEPSPSAQTQRS